MKFFSILLAASLIIVVGCSGRTETENAIISANEENTSFTTIESSEPLPTMDETLDSKECLVGLFGGRSRVDKSMWVSLEEDIEGVKKGHAVTIMLTNDLEEQVTDYEIGDRLYVYYDDISITGEPQITTPYQIVLAE